MESDQVSFLHPPQELVERILDHLLLHSVQDLGLVSRDMCALASGRRFHGFLTRQTTNLMPSSLCR